MNAIPILTTNFDEILIQLQMVAKKAEAALLGALLLKPELISDVKAKEDDFVDTRHKHIFETLIKLAKEGRGIDKLITDLEIRKNTGKDIGVYISSLTEAVPKSDNIDCYDDLVLDYSKRRKFISKQKDICEAVLQEKDFEKILNMSNELEEELISITRKDNFLIYVTDQIDNCFEVTKDIDKNLIGLGYPTIDNAIGGLMGGEVLTILGGPGVGKSAFKQNIISYMCQKYDCGILSFELEMPQTQFSIRQMQLDFGVERNDVIEALKERDSNNPIIETARYMKKYKNLFIVEKSVDIQDIRVLIKRANNMKQIAPIKIVFIDHFRYLRAYGTEVEKATFLYPEIKQLAKEFNVVIVVLHHPHRGESESEGYRPLKLSSGRGSGAIENDSDFVIALYREELDPTLTELQREEVRDKISIQVLKNRRGFCGIFNNFIFEKSIMKIKETN